VWSSTRRFVLVSQIVAPNSTPQASAVTGQ